MKKIRLVIGSLLILGFAGIIAAPVQVYAVNPAQQVCAGTGGHINATGQCVGNSDQGNLASLVKTIINVLLYLIGIIAVIVIIIGAIRYVTSAGDSSKVKGAKDTILYAVIGLVIAIIAYAIVNFVVRAF